MGPIMGVGLSVGLNDFELMKRSLKSFLITTAFSVTTATIFFLFTPIAEAQSELLARTSPTIYDVFIALFGGLAGVVALSTKEKGNVIPGVAIATALMPPLCTAGYGLASGNLVYFLGAFYLYFINSVFISLATFIGVRVMHFQRKEFVDKAREKMVRKYIILIVVLTMCPAVYLTFGIIKSTFYETAANRFINEQLNFENTQVLDKKMELLTPTDGTFLVDYDECDPRYDLSLYYQQGSNYYELVYYPKVITEARARLAYEVRVRDSYGYESRSRFEHCFANALYVVPSGGGTVSAAGALHAETANGGMLRAACYERGCTLTATADAGYRFAGWYADEGHSELLCKSETYSYVPKTYATSLYPLFVTEKVHILTDIYTIHFECDAPVEVDQDEESFIVPAGSRCTIRAMEPALLTGWYDAFDKSRRQLITADKTYSFVATEKRIIAPDYAEGTDLSAAGTANSYIAPRMQEIYLFDATVQGNGRATTGITPQKLKGTSARLIWQTGTAERAVVCDVGYNGSRISFRTGTAIGGNALIGLFDKDGDCIWSWHIWATNGALTTHVYPSGYVFMDRNLGAENLDPGDPASRGLYYQWGRKDPFPYDLEAFDYGEGFAFGTYYGEDSSTATVAWAAAHPATLLGRAADPSDPAQRLSSWLGQPSPNLWGNASTGGRPTTAGAKSIYDPCPPGWRVPPPEAWTLEQTTVSSTIEGGCYLYTGSVWPYYPYAGLLHVMPTGKEMYVGVGIRTQLWTNAPGSPASDPSRVDATTAVSFGVLPPEVLQLYRQNHQAAAYPVRCVKE